jgi:hypothetical protein
VSAVVVLLVTALTAVFLVPRIIGGSDGPGPAAWDPRVTDLVQFVEEERGLTFEHPVPVDFLTQKEFREELTTKENDLTAKDRHELQATEAILRALGLLHGNIDLLDEFNTLGTEDVGAFYDPTRKRVFVPEGPLTSWRRAILVHELTHALQDQRFELAGLEDRAPDDEASAQRALIEGDARRIEQAYVRSLSDGDRARYREEANRGAAAARKGIAGVPSVIRAVFESPYALGEVLMAALLLDGGPDRIDEAFEQPPTSEEHLLDPFTFLDGDEPIDVPVPTLETGETEVDTRDLGAITWYLLLAERLDPRTALRAVDGWGGDEYVIYRSEDRICVRAAFQGDDALETDQMEGALTAWVDTMPPGDAAVTRDGEILTLRSCDPGPRVSASTRDVSEQALLVPLVRTSFAIAFERGGFDRTVARCAATSVINRLPAESLLNLKALMRTQAFGKRIRELAPAALTSCGATAG